ncbi:MAG: hypothetical protein HY057_04790 [Rhodospirillales bacterium]|nr:hypothetical protein [Rhodospirillales bacterium]
MHFSEEQIKKIGNELSTIEEKYTGLLIAYGSRNYTNKRAHEYAVHGFSRRLATLKRCIVRVFEILPPDRIDPPAPEDCVDAAIYIQAFVFNVFGCTDNLAWIWVQEKNLTKTDGRPIPNSQVGLRKDNSDVRQSFSPDFQRYLTGLDSWFENLENFRHALAHRIPLYIVPKML